ncbi:MAG TPA: DUF4910 domain-containing protein, partial [Pirellulales bacterium]|nr:DUF4910 domain-containing protein [Pirellulales bacterium]
MEDVRHGGRRSAAWSPDGDGVITRSVMSTMAVGDELHALVARLYPLCRSLTGPGVRQTLAILQERLPLTIHEVPTGTRAFDWTVPQEWRIRDAYVKDASGVRRIDYRNSNLHVVNYSVGIEQRMPWRELKKHVHTLPDRPEWIPYRTSYYQPTWGFCIAYREWLEFERRGDDVEYDVLIDAEHLDGSLSYGEYYLPGESTDEVLFSCHVCHPSLANDNLSGVAVAAFLAQHLSQSPRRYSYRFMFVPATIGPLVWLSRHQGSLDRIKHGLVLTLLGDRGKFTYKRSRRGDAAIDRAAVHVLGHSPGGHRLLDFAPLGYDERQYCSPGFNLPIGCLMRTPHGEFAEYHTSADNLDFVSPVSLAESLATCISIVEVLERDRTYFNRHPYGEPQLGRRGLYATLGGKADRGDIERAILWVLNLSDGGHSLLDIAQRSGLPLATIAQAGDLLLTHHLIREVDSGQIVAFRSAKERSFAE